MRSRLVLPAAVVLLLGARPFAQDKPADNPQVLAALKQYAGRDFNAAVPYLQSISSLKQFQFDLDRMANGWLKGSVVPASTARQALAGAALEAASLHLGDPSAGKLVEWACKYVREDTAAAEFDRRWMRASMAVLEGAMQPKLLATHLEHVSKVLPGEPHLALARGLADEQRTAPWFAKTGITAPDILPLAESAIKKYQDAAKLEDVHAEAMLRIGSLESRLRRNDDAVAALTDAEAHTTDPSLLYLARVFRGQALERLNKAADAQATYRAALETVPGGYAATMALAAALATGNQRVEASAAIDRLITTPASVPDPWWSYWPADFRYADNLILQMREALR